MLYDRAKGESTPLFVSQPSLLDYKFAHMEDVRIKARDGLEHWTLTPTLTLTLTRTPTLTPTLTPTPTLIPTQGRGGHGGSFRQFRCGIASRP